MLAGYLPGAARIMMPRRGPLSIPAFPCQGRYSDSPAFFFQQIQSPIFLEVSSPVLSPLTRVGWWGSASPRGPASSFDSCRMPLPQRGRKKASDPCSPPAAAQCSPRDFDPQDERDGDGPWVPEDLRQLRPQCGRPREDRGEEALNRIRLSPTAPALRSQDPGAWASSARPLACIGGGRMVVF